MKRTLLLANIANVEADALIYSTNVQLALTGGVGAALKKKYGFQIQMDLVAAFNQSKKVQSNVGDVYITQPDYTPYRFLFNTIATSENFITKRETVIAILKHCLDHCVTQGGVERVVCSPIGSGFGDLTTQAYCQCLEQALEGLQDSLIREFIVACYDQHQFNELQHCLPAWESSILEKPRVFFEGRKKKNSD